MMAMICRIVGGGYSMFLFLHDNHYIVRTNVRVRTIFGPLRANGALHNIIGNDVHYIC